MLQLLALILVTLGIQYSYVDQIPVDKNFALIDDFNKNQKLFLSDTFDLVNQSTDRGELIEFHNKDKDYMVFDIWLFGEMGKIHATYWTDKSSNFKLVRFTTFDYDKTYYEKGYKVTESTDYFSYTKKSVRRYGADKKEVKDVRTDEDAKEAESLFREAMKLKTRK